MATSKDSETEGASADHQKEEEVAQEHSSPRAIIIHEIIREDGEQELQREVSALALSGLAAGLSMGFSFLGPALLSGQLVVLGVTGDWRIFTSLGYSLGFLFVVLGRQQLFTESTLTAVLPLATRHDLKTLYLTTRLWVIVLAANTVGTWIFAALLSYTGIFTPETTDALHKLAGSALHFGFGTTLLKAILAGWLIALMVWILPSTQSARLLCIVIVTYVVALGNFSHIVAGSTEYAYAVLGHMTDLGDYAFGFFLPTLIGNIIGGVGFVSMLNHGAIKPEIEPD